MNNSVIIVGDTNVGKSSLITFLREGKINQQQLATQGLAFYRYDFEVENQKKYINLWDSAGQDKYQSAIRPHIDRHRAIILMFDLSSSSSFQTIKERYKWYKKQLPPEQALYCDIGNKSDLQRTIDKDYINQFWAVQGIQYIQMSLKTGSYTKKTIDRILKKFWFQSQYKITKKGISLQENINVQPQQKRRCC